ncbi:MAG TPA: PAS domain S-box protein [Parafilimonas sp.]|nr:PAS domain S-box protein [Parafilimonas sp.]
MLEQTKINEESYKLLIESVKDYAIVMTDPEGYIISWNKGAEKIKGYTADEIIGQHISLFYTADEIESGEPEKNLQRAKESGRFEDEGWRVRKNGSRFWANVGKDHRIVRVLRHALQCGARRTLMSAHREVVILRCKNYGP